ncbi:MAG: dihydropteroate synthase [Candidatus Peribacteraceae bacterium]|nr:dihydropteroate synthase [Candidatus Peribacteraceae bacterium]
MDRTQIIGVLNVTPDSFFDGGKFAGTDAALRQAARMLKEGADILEIGGESTGPGSKDVSTEEELERTMPVIEALRKNFPAATISIDTWKAAVAKEALLRGVTMVNDVTAGRDPEMFSRVAAGGAFLVMMYMKDTSARTTIRDVHYDDVIRTVTDFLRTGKGIALKAGVAPERIILDPGLGHFVSGDPKYSFEILARLDEVAALGSPVLVSPSRKSFLAGRELLKASGRLPGTIAASAIAVLHGAGYIRTHDVEPVRRACEIAEAVRQTGF